VTRLYHDYVDESAYEEIPEIENEANKDGTGRGQWSAWKAAELGKEYEKRGGDYENEPGSKNEPKTGAPRPKPNAQKQRDVKPIERDGGGDDSKGERTNKDTVKKQWSNVARGKDEVRK